MKDKDYDLTLLLCTLQNEDYLTTQMKDDTDILYVSSKHILSLVIIFI